MKPWPCIRVTLWLKKRLARCVTQWSILYVCVGFLVSNLLTLCHSVRVQSSNSDRLIPYRTLCPLKQTVYVTLFNSKGSQESDWDTLDCKTSAVRFLIKGEMSFMILTWSIDRTTSVVLLWIRSLRSKHEWSQMMDASVSLGCTVSPTKSICGKTMKTYTRHQKLAHAIVIYRHQDARVSERRYFIPDKPWGTP